MALRYLQSQMGDGYFCVEKPLVIAVINSHVLIMSYFSYFSMQKCFSYNYCPVHTCTCICEIINHYKLIIFQLHVCTFTQNS
jgi:hypothetical protein